MSAFAGTSRQTEINEVTRGRKKLGRDPFGITPRKGIQSEKARTVKEARGWPGNADLKADMGDTLFIRPDGNNFCRFDDLTLTGMAIKGARKNLNILTI